MKPVFIPEPKKLTHRPGRFVIPPKGTIGICCWKLRATAEQARTVFRRHTIGISTSRATDTITIRLGKRLNTGGYRLRIGPKGVLLEADSHSAAAHGMATLLQAAQQSPPGELPMLSIEDWPDLPHRGVYYDVARGRVPKLERLIEQAELLARYKINQLQLYVEHTFRFRGHPDIGKGASPLTADDILTLDARCRELGIELVPSLASFGHLATVLKHRQYHHLAEDWGVGRYLDPEAAKHRILRGWSLSPANPKIYDFLDSLFAEYLPLFRSNQFNVCCDETWDLGFGQSYRLCKRLGKGRVYLNHIIRLNGLCRKYGKRMMFWGDIIRHYPELIGDIPKDVTVLDWGYDHNTPFDRLADFAKAGLDFYACPATSSWVALFPRLHEARANIAGWAAAAKKHGAAGLLNTDWGDGGHCNFMECSWHGYLFGAEQAWNASADASTFTERFCKLFLGIDNARFAAAVDELGDVAHLKLIGFYQSIWEHVYFAAPGDAVFSGECRPAFISDKGRIWRRAMELTAAVGADNLRRLRRVRKALGAGAGRRGADPHRVLPQWLFAADTLIHAARKLSVVGPGGHDTAAARGSLRAEMSSLQKRFERLWLARNRRSEIGITLKRYRRALSGLRRLPAKAKPASPGKLRYILHVPAGDPGPKGWPLMLFLHGAGERGDDLNQITIYGPPKIAKKDKDFPFILVAPQCPADRWWSADELLGLLDEVTGRCAVDRDRVYVTGMSMGGFGTWALAAKAPRRFAAIAPICGGGDPATASRLKHVPVWAFHGAKDQTVPPRQSQQMVDAVRKAGGKARLTVYPEAGHDSWTKTYANPRLYAWLLRHHRKHTRRAQPALLLLRHRRKGARKTRRR